MMVGLDDRALGAYVDGELPVDEARAIDAALGSDAGLRARIAAIREATLAARAAFAAIEREPVPERLIAAVRQRKPETRLLALPGVGLAKGRGRRFAVPLAAAATVLIAAAIGVFASGLIGSRAPDQVAYEDSWLDQVKRSYERYAKVDESETRALVDVDADGAGGGEQLGAWFGEHLERQLEVPDLSAHGLILKGGRLLIVEGKPSAQILYVTEDGSPVALSVVPSVGRDQVISAQGGENANLLHWRARNYGYALIGNLTLDTMKDIADKIAPRLSPAT
jgi:anti-sigma factor RsiW